MPSSAPPLPPAVRHLALALGLLVLAGLRHHLAWGDTAPFGFRLRPWLAALETACLLGFAWFGTRGWLAAIAAVRTRTPGLRVLVRASLPLLLLALLVPPFLSADVADYVMRGRVLALHGGNPYVQVAGDFPHDPFLAFGDAAWKRFPLPYGPLVADVQGALAWLGEQATFLPPRARFVLTVALFKLLFAGCLVGAGLLARRLHAMRHGGDGDVAFVAVTWCPLLLNEALAQAHNESLLLVTLLAAGLSAVGGRTGRGIVALGLGVLTKLVPAAVAPLCVVHAARTRRWLPLLAGSAVVAALAAFWSWRYLTEPGALSFLERQNDVRLASLPWAVAAAFGVPIQAAVWGGRAVVLLVLAQALRRLWREPGADRLVHGTAAVLAAVACLGLAGFGPWYHVWWVPLAWLGPPGFLRRFAVAATATAPLAYVVWTSTRTLDGAHQAGVVLAGIVLPAALAAATRDRATAA